MKPTTLFISCEHAVDTVPPEYFHLFQAYKPLLKTHRAIDFGALEIASHLGQIFDCHPVTARVTRLLIDCNRSINNAHCFSEVTQALSDIEKQQIINQYYLPYRQEVEKCIKSLIDRKQQVLHISCHSFTPVFEGNTRNAAIGLLYDPKHHGEKEVAREWKGLLSQQSDFRIRLNYPYSGKSDGFTTYLRKKYLEKSYLGLELEINQALVEDKTVFKQLLPVLSNTLKELMQLLS